MFINKYLSFACIIWLNWWRCNFNFCYSDYFHSKISFPPIILYSTFTLIKWHGIAINGFYSMILSIIIKEIKTCLILKYNLLLRYYFLCCKSTIWLYYMEWAHSYLAFTECFLVIKQTRPWDCKVNYFLKCWICFWSKIALSVQDLVDVGIWITCHCSCGITFICTAATSWYWTEIIVGQSILTV